MGTKLDGICTTADIDSSGEIAVLGGMDISDLVAGKGHFNFEHKGKENPDCVIGKILTAKKILKKDDCENERHLKFWKHNRNRPYVYILGELYDDDDSTNVGALAIGASIRYAIKHDIPLDISYSVEGATLKRDGNYLESTVVRDMALTFKPCNRATVADVLPDEVKSLISKSEDFGYSIHLEDAVVGEDLFKSIMEGLSNLKKTLTAGMGAGAPSTLTGGSALQVEDPSLHRRIRQAVSVWDRKSPLRDIVKAVLPEVSDEYVNYFTNVAHDISLKKSDPGKTRLSLTNSLHPLPIGTEDVLEGVHVMPTDLPQNYNRVFSRPLMNDKGEDVVIRAPSTVDPSPLYYSGIAKLLGLGGNVPAISRFSHPTLPATSNGLEAVAVPANAKPAFGSDLVAAIGRGKETGLAHKLYALDLITNTPRTAANIITSGNNLYNVDNYPGTEPAFNVYEKHLAADRFHPEAKDWIKGADPAKLARYLAQLEIDPQLIKQMIYRLRVLQHGAVNDKTFKEILDDIRRTEVGNI